MATLSRPTSLIELESVPSLPDGARHDGSDVEIAADDDAQTGDGLCERCKQFDLQAFARSHARRRGYVLRDVVDAADRPDACEFCSLLFDSVKDVGRPRDHTEVERNPFHLPKNTNPDIYVHMTLSEDYADATTQTPPHGLRVNRLRAEVGDRFTEVRNASDHEVCLAAEPESAAATSGDVTGRYLGRDPGSEAHYETVRDWIKTCSTHPKCNQTVSGSENIDPHQSTLPARCVEILRGGRSARLRETGGQRGTYITLTHRWNPETESCRTTTANYAQRLEGRDFESIPQLFRDVFGVAAKLDVQYVWIDSICIIQHGDNGADWRMEAPKMAQYYQFSLLTIAGTMSDMENGILCLYPEDSTPWESKLVEMPYRDKSNAPAGQFYVYKRKVPLVDEYWATVRKSILFQRGWILQEWLLSKRLLWYTSKGLFFECHTDGPRSEYQEKIIVELTSPNLRSHLQLKGSFHFQSASILDFWYQALEVYSVCDLTKPEQDRILAVAGVAKEVGLILTNLIREPVIDGVHHELYLAGLWLRDLHHGILWEEDHAARPWTMKLKDAPSWSWASLMTPVRWPERAKETKKAFKVTGICLKQRDTHITPEYVIERNRAVRRPDGNGTGSRADRLECTAFDPLNMFACLHIRGKLCTVHVRGYLGTEENLHTAAFSTAYGSSPTSCQWRAICAPARPERIAGWGSLEQLRVDDARCADSGFAVYALHISTRYLKSGWMLKHTDSILHVLFLEEVGAGNHVFRRLGVGRISDNPLIVEYEATGERDIRLI